MYRQQMMQISQRLLRKHLRQQRKQKILLQNHRQKNRLLRNKIRQNSRLQKMLQVNCRRRTSSTYYPAHRLIRRNMMHSPISL